MPTNVEVPALGESVREAVLLKWHKNEGDTVAAADPLCELETDKANVDVPAPIPGVLHRLKNEGDTVKIGETIAQIDESAAPTRGQSAAPAPIESTKKEPKPEDLRPSVRRVVAEEKIDPATIKPTGPHGMATKEDAERAVLEGEAPAEPRLPARQEPCPPMETRRLAASDDAIRRVPISKIRKRIAENLLRAESTAAILHTYNEADMSAIIDLRTKFKERFQEIYGVGLGFMSFFARAVVLAIHEFPKVNAQLDGDDIVYHDFVNLGIAVSTDRGLAVPVLRHVEQMSFATIEAEIKRLAGATRDGKLSLEELSGGTFTITNGGIFGSLMSTPILNPPQSAILGMHAIKKRPVVVDDAIVIRPMMYLVLGYDHRLIDGRESVSFLVRLKEFLEDPARLMLEI